MADLSAALQELEIKLAFLERANGDLSEVVYSQQRALQVLEQRLAVLETQVAMLRQADSEP